jgi:hypothetical protein
MISQLTRSQELYERALRVLSGGVSRNTVLRRPHPLYAAKGEGCYVTDIEGVRRIDFANNMASLIHPVHDVHRRRPGHCADAGAVQLRRLKCHVGWRTISAGPPEGGNKNGIANAVFTVLTQLSHGPGKCR